ncbi:MAG: hypothetical protein NTY38_30595, partial [Acidobacteria bacterium]|nr:hypothetical protein [Acidobacteriota bacterium]
SSAVAFTASASGRSNGRTWLSVSPSGARTTNQALAVAVNPAGLAANSYTGSISLAAGSQTYTVPVTLTVTGSGGGGGAGGYKLIGWNDLGMHCLDGKDYSVFAVLPPFNTIHAHLIDPSGRLVLSDIGNTVTYEAIRDPLTNTLNTTSKGKTNFWQYAAALGFGALQPDAGLMGYRMPGVSNTPQAMNFSTTDNTFTAVGIPILPYPDSAATPVNYLPMMRISAKNSLGAVLATTDIVLPTSDEMTCSVCHASNAGTQAAQPAAGWVNRADQAQDVKFNILRKHDDRFRNSALFQAGAVKFGYNSAGLEATVAAKPILCGSCHGTNALGAPGIAGVQSLTTAMHGSHAGAIDPGTNATLESATGRDACYRCHPGPKTQCFRGAMSTIKTASGGNAIECQNCHGSMSNVAVSTRSGWLDEPSCQGCHTGTATNNNGQIVYTSVFESGNIARTAKDQTFATNPNTPSAGLSLYRFSKGHGGLQCESCHGSTHAEFITASVNDNVQSTNLQGHSGMLAECSACHATVPNTVTGGPHGLHPIGAPWVSAHQDVAEKNGASAC